jgi:hypothetical protein
MEDFRTRLQHVLFNPELPLPPIDPAGWVSRRCYMSQNYDLVVRAFLAERQHSLERLRSLDLPNLPWRQAYQHPKFGSLSAKMFFTNRLGHYYLHLRQITKLRFDYLRHLSGEQLHYAGDW